MTSPPASGGDTTADSATTITGRSAAIAVAVILIADFMDLLDAAIAADLGASESALQWTVAGYTLALGAGLITGGRIGDQFGHRRVFLLGLIGFTLTSAGCALAPTPDVLIATRVAQGLAGGLMVPQVFGIIRSSFEHDDPACRYPETSPPSLRAAQQPWATEAEQPVRRFRPETVPPYDAKKDLAPHPTRMGSKPGEGGSGRVKLPARQRNRKVTVRGGTA